MIPDELLPPGKEAVTFALTSRMSVSPVLLNTVYTWGLEPKSDGQHGARINVVWLLWKLPSDTRLGRERFQDFVERPEFHDFFVGWKSEVLHNAIQFQTNWMENAWNCKIRLQF